MKPIFKRDPVDILARQMRSWCEFSEKNMKIREIGGDIWKFNSLSFALSFKSIRRLELEILTKMACGVGWSTIVDIRSERVKVNDLRSTSSIPRLPMF